MDTSAWVHEAISRLVVDASKVYAVCLGVVLLLGGSDRMQAPAYAVLVDWAPWWFWGGSLVVAGLVTFVPKLIVRVVGYWVTAVWMWVWWAALTANVLWDLYAPVDPTLPKPGLTGLPTYAYLMVIFTALAVASFMDWRGRSVHVHATS